MKITEQTDFYITIVFSHSYF